MMPMGSGVSDDHPSRASVLDCFSLRSFVGWDFLRRERRHHLSLSLMYETLCARVLVYRRP